MFKTHRVNQGDAFNLKAPLTIDGEAAPIDGRALEFLVFREDDSANAIISLTTGNGGVVPYDANTFEIVGPGAATLGQTIGRYNFVIRTSGPEPTPQTLESGLFYIDPPKRTA